MGHRLGRNSPALDDIAVVSHPPIGLAAQPVPDIDIADDGPGVAETQHDGAGLGLPLARRPARAVVGDASYDPAHAPEARLTVSAPLG